MVLTRSGTSMIRNNAVVLDASALLAFALGERRGAPVGRLLDVCSMNAVNVAECVAVLARASSVRAATSAVARLGLHVVECDEEIAYRAAAFHAASRLRYMSLSGCICLATAQRIGARVISADWELQWLETGVKVEMLVDRYA